MSRLRGNDPCWCASGRKLKRCHGDFASRQRSPVRCGTVSAPRDVPASIARPPYVAAGGWPTGDRGLQILRGAQVDRMRHAGRVAAEVLLETGAAVAPGVTTDQLDAIAHDAYLRRGAYPSTLHYKGFTKSICTSVNEVVCHGIPDDRPLVEGDIVNIDVTAYIDGMHGDTSATFAVGQIDEPTIALVDATRRATLLGVGVVAPGRSMREIGATIEQFAQRRGLGVVRDYGGHGIGQVFHAEPHVFHIDERRASLPMVPGMAFTIEPMLCAGSHHHHDEVDGWTVVADDLLPSAQFEHTVVVTEEGVEIITVDADGGSAVGVL